MAAIDDLISQIADKDLRERLQLEVDKLSKQKKFGLVYEEHIPECTPLYDIPIKKGSLVSLKSGNLQDNYLVTAIESECVTCLNLVTKEVFRFEKDDLVTIARFGEPIYPYLQPIDKLCNAPDSDLWHTLIEADNYHALQLLEYLYAGKVDCIYIDPPYNTGARDWKYNNDYVDGNDCYRHSKWLSMMEKRLRLAKKLLNPKDSVLIVTIDEKEYLHLGCLLEEIFSESNMQMISSVINPKGAVRHNSFARTDEYIFIVMIGNCEIAPEIRENGRTPIYWQNFRRSNIANTRDSRPNQFYPIYVENATNRIIAIGDTIPLSMNINEVPSVDGCTTVFPQRPNGKEMLWGVTPDRARYLLSKGFMRASSFDDSKPQKYVISYLVSGTARDVESGKATITGYSSDGSVIAFYPVGKEKMPTSNWNNPSHNAQIHGTNLLKSIIGNRFDFPKSLYAVHDTIKYFIANKPSAFVVDFFAGSGTTLHAVNLLNAEDGGNRRCIMVTNNELSEEESKTMKSKGHQPGDEEWDRLGIARYVTWPRTVCSIEGHDISGMPLQGKYIGSDIPMEEGFAANVAFFKLGFLDKTSVALGKQFNSMLPTLWLKAGTFGPCPDAIAEDTSMLVLPQNKFAVLIDITSFPEFERLVLQQSEIKTVYIITDSEPGYREMIKSFDGKETYQLYRDYLDNFRINIGR